MIAQRKPHILARLEIGLRTDSARLIELEEELRIAMHRSRALGSEYGSPDDWSIAWCHHWDLIEAILHRIRGLVDEMHTCVRSHAGNRFVQALLAWQTLKVEDTRLKQTLEALHGQAIGLNVTAQVEWEATARALETHLETIHACADALRIKLELLVEHSNEEVDAQVQKILTRLSRHPQPQALGASEYEKEYQKAAVELKQERNQFMGFVDVIQGMFMWVETPEERTDKNLSVSAKQMSHERREI